MRRWRRDNSESAREPLVPVSRQNPRPRRLDHFLKAQAGFGAYAAGAFGTSIGVSLNELLSKGVSMGLVNVGLGAVLGSLSGELIRRASVGYAGYRKARKEYSQGGPAPNAAGATIRDVKSDLGLAQGKAQQGINKYKSARSKFEEALTVAAEAMDGSTHGDAEESRRGLEAAISAIRLAITAAENGRDGYGKLAEQL